MSLKNKSEKESANSEVNTEENLPLGEIKFLEWESEDSDHKGFTLVESKRSKQKLRSKKPTKARGRQTHPLDGKLPPEEGITMTCSGYNLRKGVGLKKEKVIK